MKKYHENLSGLPLKVKIQKKYDEYYKSASVKWSAEYEEHTEAWDKVGNYLFSGFFIFVPLTIVLGITGLLTFWRAFFIMMGLPFLVFIIEYYYIWFRKGWEDDYEKTSKNED